MRIVIVGAGPAGVSVVETVRAQDRSAELVVISAEPYPPYSPPAMVDHFITGSAAHLWRGERWSEAMGVSYHRGVAVTAVQPGDRQVLLADGRRFSYDRLVIATGSRLYANVAGADLPGVYNFKSLSAAEALLRQVKEGAARRAVIVGAGFIGMEIALLLRHFGVQVIQLEMLDQVMPGMLDQDTARAALEMMQRRGVEVRLKTKAQRFTGNGRATGVLLESGEQLHADILVAATGVRPNLEWVQGSPITCGWGITVDDYLRTNYPGVYAAGDVIEASDLLTGERYVHAIFPNAVEQGRIVGLNLLGYPARYEGAERINSLKHLDLPVVAAGLKQGDEVLKSRIGGGWRTLYLRQNVLVGFQLVGDIRAAGVLRSLMNARRDLSPLKERLLDPNFGQGVIAWQALRG